MKNHNEIEHLIQKRFDRNITAEEEKALNLHLDGCAPCRELNRSMEQIKSSIFGLIEFYPSTNFNARVMARLGFKKSLAWAKAAAILGASWAATTLFILFSPTTKTALGKLLTSMPQVMRGIEKARLVIDTVGHFVTPLVKSAWNPLYLAVGLSICATIFILFSKTIKKEETCSAS